MEREKNTKIIICEANLLFMRKRFECISHDFGI